MTPKQILHKYMKWILISVGIVMLVIILIVVGNKINQPLIPSVVSSKANFSILYPSKISGIVALRSTITYSASNSALSYTVLVDNKKVVVSEQTEPSVFNQDGVYDYKLDQANQYDSLNTASGSLALTKPSGLGGQTVAWLTSKGTLVLARAFQKLNNNEWELLFNHLEVVS